MLPSGLPEIVEDAEVTARYLVSSSWFAATTGRVKPNAYLPARDNDTSVFRIDVSHKEELWAVGMEVLKDRPFHGAAFVETSVIRKAGLNVVAAEPPPKHANIRGWLTSDDPELQKARRISTAQLISEEAILSLK